jgi:hypothetical protein
VFIYVCHQCYQPTYVNADNQPTPGAAFGGQVENLPIEIEELYREICNCAKVSAYTGSVLLCRKLLMNIAVTKGAPANKNFVFYVKYLADNGYIPPNAHGWVDHIREKGNEANHEIVLMKPDDAKNLILLAEMLLKIIYEFPARIPAPLTTPQAT